MRNAYNGRFDVAILLPILGWGPKIEFLVSHGLLTGTDRPDY